MMARCALLVFLFLCVPLPTHADDTYPLLVVSGGSTAINWRNDVQIDWVIVENRTSAACSEPVNAAAQPAALFVATLVPTNPDPPCLIRPGDQLFLRRYRQRVLIDILGPYIAPTYVYLPVVALE